MCELAIGESTVLSIERRPDAGTLLMTSVVADALPDPVDYALVLDLLEFSLGGAINGTPAIGRDAESGLIVAHQTITERNLREASFADIVKDFLRFREVMERKLFEPEAWRGGENTDAYREKGGAGITSSEMRHAVKMGDDTTVIRV